MGFDPLLLFWLLLFFLLLLLLLFLLLPSFLHFGFGAGDATGFRKSGWIDVEAEQKKFNFNENERTPSKIITNRLYWNNVSGPNINN